MSEKQITVTLPNGESATGVELSILQSEEPWYNVTLSDGTVLRIKNVPTAAIRLDNRFDADGNPVYVLKNAAVMTVLKVPDELMRNT
jgi:hypothetical protein